MIRVLSAAFAAGLAMVIFTAPATAADDKQPALLGRAILPSDAYQPGPPSGAFIRGDNGVTPPFPGQPVPGFSAVLDAGHGQFWPMPDNGYGAKTNSGDFLLRLYKIRPDFRTPTQGTGTVAVLGFLQLRDPDMMIPFTLFRPDRLLTGADFDLESVRRAKDGSFWFGEEFGPFLLHTDASGKVLEAPVPLPGVQSPQNPFLPDPDAWTLRASRGFEGMAGSVFAAVVALTVWVAGSGLAATSVKPYVEPVGGSYQVKALFSADDKVPLLGGAPGQEYRMVGIPDGLGAHPDRDDTSTLFMNHELGFTAQSEPVVGGPKNRGAIVSQWTLNGDGDPVAGKRAYDRIFDENTLLGPAPVVGNEAQMPRQFARFCSGFLAGPTNGFDRHIYLTNEEATAPDTFDGMGGLSVAIYNGELHTLPKLGRYPKENTVVQPSRGSQTVIFATEDGPATLDNQLYMYVGKKERSRNASALARNGLDNGKLYVFRSLDPNRNSERTFTSGSVTGEWLEIPNAEDLADAQLEAASDAAGAMTFVRPEDGAFNPNNPNEFFFDTTGSSSGADDGVNELGRLYSLRLHPGDPLKPATLSVVFNSDAVVAAGDDIAISPDNIDVSSQYLMINEDGTTESRAVMAAKGRDGSIWRFDLAKGPAGAVGVDVSTATRVAQLDPPGRDGVAVGPGVWETSGIIDASRLFGRDTWLSDVQAHPPTAAPGGSTVTVEDGQLFLLHPSG